MCAVTELVRSFIKKHLNVFFYFHLNAQIETCTSHYTFKVYSFLFTAIAFIAIFDYYYFICLETWSP